MALRHSSYFQFSHLTVFYNHLKTMTATLTYTLLLALILVGRKAITFIQEQT